MELLLLLGLGAFLLTRTQNTTVTSAAAAQSAAAAAAAASGVPQIEISRIRLPHIILNGQEVIWTNAELPSTAVTYKFVECKQPGGANRILDIQNKFSQYENLKADWVLRGRPRRRKFTQPLQNAATAYQNALTAHLQNCTNYQKQL
jgi:hypothetical protein